MDLRIRSRLLPPLWLPAPAQAVVAVETREGDAATAALMAPLEHPPTRIRIEAERALNRALHGSCHVPVAAYAELDGTRLHLQALVGSATDGSQVRAESEGPADAPQALGRHVAAELLAKGAGRFL
jgi:hydroxymethylbilane synthase